jgi:2-C-methyl-D-erythritol 4-phosphate cytidylyltransferase
MVLIHDAARPLVSLREISACIAAVRRYGAAVMARPVTDTLKRAGNEQEATATVDRRGLWAAQTPQGFRTDLLFLAYRQAIAENWSVTDDTSVVERLGYRVQLVHGEAMNIKITHPLDLVIGEFLLKH